MPKRNYGYEKRQKELNRQKKREEKAQKKLDRDVHPSAPETEPEEPRPAQ